MTKRTRLFFVLVILATPALPGCMPKMTIEQMKAMMPERPAELDKLNRFVGEWESTGEAEFGGLDRVLKNTGTSHIVWGNDGWCLVEHAEFEMEEFGTMKAIGVWSYDPKSKKYRTSWFDTLGSIGQGTITCDESANTWTMKAKSRGAMGTTTGRGTIMFIDKDTMEWSFTERAFFGLFKVGEYTGTSRRK